MKDKVILVHDGLGLGSVGLDFIVKKDLEEKYRYLKDIFYEMDCGVAKAFIKKHGQNEYVLIASEDLSHCAMTVADILKKIVELVNEGFEIVYWNGE